MGMSFMKCELQYTAPQITSAAITLMAIPRVGVNGDHFISSRTVVMTKYLHLGNTDFLSLKGTSLD